MKRLTVLVIPLFLFLLSGLLPAQQGSSETEVREIRMTAQKYRFDPQEIRVREGERVRLLITALDRKHGIRIKEFGVKTVLEKGKETVVEFVAERVGEYKFKCSVRCGWRHGSMKGKLIVEPAEVTE
ncbi:MAG: cupredoxin domain-containing protein [Acidobacteria bacterium]|nr:cupredoxin domain-containing protein [Acidobacteriota bacterium]MCH8946210.1 cupredoxin domain-containing protein [Acidobacteriota bacterium]